MDASHEHGATTCNGHVWHAIVAYDVAANDGPTTSNAVADDGLIAHDVTYDAAACHAAACHAIACDVATYDATASNAIACHVITHDADTRYASTTHGSNSNDAISNQLKPVIVVVEVTRITDDKQLVRY